METAMATYFIIIALHLGLLSRSYTVSKFMNIPSKGVQFMVFPSRGHTSPKENVLPTPLN